MQRLEKLDKNTIRLILGGAVALVLVVLLAVSVFGGDEADSSSSGAAASAAEDQLVERAGEYDHPIFWAGSRPTVEQYEMTSTADGRIYIRYLTDGAAPGDPRPDFLTVATYPVEDAAGAFEKASDGDASKIVEHEGFKVLAGDSSNAYVIFDDQPKLQVEVFSPVAGEAVQIANSGALKPLR